MIGHPRPTDLGIGIKIQVSMPLMRNECHTRVSGVEIELVQLACIRLPSSRIREFKESPYAPTVKQV